MARELPAHVREAIKSGPIPVLREWRGLEVAEMTRAERNMAFIEEYCIVPEGKLVGNPVKLAVFQEAFFYAVYDNPVRTTEAYLSIARKNAKTALIAMMMLVHLAGPEAVTNSEISSGAMSRDQAAQVYKYASKMVAMSPDLRGLVRPVSSSKKLVGLARNVEYGALSADAGTNHGRSPILAILDEVGQIKDETDDFVEAIETSQGAYDDMALLVMISTQAATDDVLWSIRLDEAELADDANIVSHVYSAPKDCDLNDRQAWQAANPALGLFRSISDLSDKAEKATRSPSREPGFRNLLLNQRVSSKPLFLPPAIWKRCAEMPKPLIGQVYGGLDLAKVTDLAAFVLIGEHEDGIWDVHPHFWLPEDKVQEYTRRNRAKYDLWVKRGYLRTTPGAVLDYTILAADLAEICAGLSLEGVAVDPWKIDLLKKAIDLVNTERKSKGLPLLDLPLVPFSQQMKMISPALDVTETNFLKGRVRHGGHPVMNMCSSNAVVYEHPGSENRKLNKKISTGRIDGVQAMAMAFGLTSKPGDQTNLDDFLDAPVMVI